MLIPAFAMRGPIVLGLDDTIERRRGLQIEAKGIYRDPVRSTHSHFVKASGLRWLSLMLLAPVPWAKRVWALPFLTVLAPSERYYKGKVRKDKKLTQWALQVILQARRWLPKRFLVVQAIAAAGLPLKLHGRRWPEMADLAPYAVGPLDSRQALREVVDSRQGGAGLVLIHVWPVPYAHPIEAMENPIIRAAGMDRAAFLALCQAALNGQTVVAQSQRHLLSDQAIKSLLVS